MGADEDDVVAVAVAAAVPEPDPLVRDTEADPDNIVPTEGPEDPLNGSGGDVWMVNEDSLEEDCAKTECRQPISPSPRSISSKVALT